jgi:hypothetical protein
VQLLAFFLTSPDKGNITALRGAANLLFPAAAGQMILAPFRYL